MFVALPTIPAYGVTDFGLIDVATQQLVDVVLPASHGDSEVSSGATSSGTQRLPMTDTLVASSPRIVAFDVDGRRRIGVVLGTRVHDVSEEIGAIGLALTNSSSALESLAGRGSSVYDLGAVRLLPPVDRSARIFCVALNYRAHADESGGADPGLPVIFHKMDTTLIGPFDEIQTPSYTNFLDYEAELAVVIGRDAHRASASD
jgi:hypothetical protein